MKNLFDQHSYSSFLKSFYYVPIWVKLLANFKTAHNLK